MMLQAEMIDHESDLQWHREQRALHSITPSEILEEVDDLIASEPNPTDHPLYSLVAHTLDLRVQAGSSEALQQRLQRLIDWAIERVVVTRLSQIGD